MNGYDNAPNDIKLLLNNHPFLAYLEDSDIIHEMKEQQLPFAPVSFNNDSMALRVTERVKFTFNVFSNTRYECIRNFVSLTNLINEIKPSYKLVFNQYVPLPTNVSGYFKIKFDGFPGRKRDEITVHLTNFSYNINKDLGFIQVPNKEITLRESVEGERNEDLYTEGQMKLIPISYKISIEGKVLLPFLDTIRGNVSDEFYSVSEATRLPEQAASASSAAVKAAKEAAAKKQVTAPRRGTGRRGDRQNAKRPKRDMSLIIKESYILKSFQLITPGISGIPNLQELSKNYIIPDVLYDMYINNPTKQNLDNLVRNIRPKQ